MIANEQSREKTLGLEGSSIIVMCKQYCCRQKEFSAGLQTCIVRCRLWFGSITRLVITYQSRSLEPMKRDVRLMQHYPSQPIRRWQLVEKQNALVRAVWSFFIYFFFERVRCFDFSLCLNIAESLRRRAYSKVCFNINTKQWSKKQIERMHTQPSDRCVCH